MAEWNRFVISAGNEKGKVKRKQLPKLIKDKFHTPTLNRD